MNESDNNTVAPSGSRETAYSAAQFFTHAQVMLSKGDLAGAARICEHLLFLKSDWPDALHLSGLVELQRGNFDLAEKLIAAAIKLKPGQPVFHVNLGVLYKEEKKYPEAIEALQEALRLSPILAEALYNLGAVYFDQEQYGAAIQTYEKYLQLRPDDTRALTNLGNAYGREGGWPRAIQLYERALSINPNFNEAYANLGATFRGRGWPFAAAGLYTAAIRTGSARAVDQYQRAICLLTAGNLGEGWVDHEARFLLTGVDSVLKRVGPPYWAGEDLGGKSIFVWPEQGQGEQIIYASILPDLAQVAGKVVVECKSRLEPVFRRSFPDLTIVARPSDWNRPYAGPPVDYQIAMASLGRFFRPDLESFPARQGFLLTDLDTTRKLRARYETLARGRRIVGLSWRSRNETLSELKSIPLSAWSAVLKAPGVMFVNLQYGDCRTELAAVKAELGIDIYQDPDVDPLQDMDVFLAQVKALDLVISTSNTTAHAAGALNVPAWVILPRGVGSLWYWFLHRENSPWYPSLRLFRQDNETPIGDLWWGKVVTRIGKELGVWAESA